MEIDIEKLLENPSYKILLAIVCVCLAIAFSDFNKTSAIFGFLGFSSFAWGGLQLINDDGGY